MSDFKVIWYKECGIDFAGLMVEREMMHKSDYGNRDRGRKGRTYLDVLTAFDIETSNITAPDGTLHSYMYVWQWCLYELGIVVMGRTWEEYLSLCEELCSCLPDKGYIICLVHNLSFEFTFLSGIASFPQEGVFCLDKRSILNAEMNEHFEFRCTYRHSNMSLKMYLKKWNAEHQKLDDDFDYSKVRYPWTELSESEIEYCTHDVIGLCEAYKAEMKFNKDNVFTVPATSTGYVRREVRKVMQGHYSWLAYQTPTYEVYKLLRKAFRGGDTHASRFYLNKLLHTVQSWDRSSSYPDVLINCLFPVTKFQRVSDSLYNGFDFYSKENRGHAFLCRGVYKNLRLRKDSICYPYLPESKCEGNGAEKCAVHMMKDNGRVLSADSVTVTMTDVDFIIFRDCYAWDEDNSFFTDIYYATYGKMPSDFLDLVRFYYTQKTALKGVDDPELAKQYDKMKALLNSLYGLLAQDPCKDKVVYNELADEDDEQGLYQLDDTMSDEEKLDKFYSHPYSMYQHGVWVTAWARYRLWELMKIVGTDKLVYWDTDSVKFVGDADFTEYNAQRMKDSKLNGAYAVDKKGTTHYMGVVEQEETYTSFKTLGAKKYAFTHGEEIGVTVSGVVKKEGGKELQKLGGLDAFREGMQFIDAGGLMLTYHDWDDFHMTVEGHDLHITRNVTLSPDIYTVGFSDDYKRLLQLIELSENKIENRIDIYDDDVL